MHKTAKNQVIFRSISLYLHAFRVAINAENFCSTLFEMDLENLQ
jgi:hypothetical protein